MKPQTILTAMEDRHLFYPWFQRRLLGFGGDSWETWKVFLSVVFGLRLTDKQLFIFRKYTGRRANPIASFSEAWAIAGRGAGKSLIAALVITYVACFMDHPNLVPGETAMAICMASDKNQARVVMSYVLAFFDGIPLLAAMEESRTKESITLKNGIIISVIANDYRTVRGRSLLCVVCDEISFWAADENSASPDIEVLTAVRPGLARVPNSKLICISSPYGEKGELYRTYKKHHGRDDSKILCWMADTRSMNPTHSQSVIDDEFEKDPERAAAEWGFGFRSDLESFLSRQVVEAAVDRDVFERGPGAGFDVQYHAFIDASGGRGDSFTAAISHYDSVSHQAVLDLILEFTPPFSPKAVVGQICKSLQRYGVDRVVGDQYGAELTVEHFRDHGIEFSASDKNRSEIYLNLGRALRSSQVRLLDHERLVNQLVGLQRRVGNQGHDTIDHGHGAHDDIANSAAGSLLLALAGHDQYGALEYQLAEMRGGFSLKTPLTFMARAEAHHQKLQQGGPNRITRQTFENNIQGKPAGTPLVKCPAGHSVNVRVIPGGQFRCGDCGAQWPDGTAPPVYLGGNRRGR